MPTSESTDHDARHPGQDDTRRAERRSIRPSSRVRPTRRQPLARGSRPRPRRGVSRRADRGRRRHVGDHPGDEDQCRATAAPRRARASRATRRGRPLGPVSTSPEPGRSERSTDQVEDRRHQRPGSPSRSTATSTAEPTVAFGLKRMIRNAASYMSPSPSGRSGIAPGLWAAPSIPGGGAQAAGVGVAVAGPEYGGAGCCGGPQPGGGGWGGGVQPGGGGKPPVPGSDMPPSCQVARSPGRPAVARSAGWPPSISFCR